MPDARTAARAPVLAVFVGGTAGTALRAAVGLAVPTAGGVPVATIGINVVGAFALGLLLAALARRGPDTGRRRLGSLALGLVVGLGAHALLPDGARLLAGTGFLGGYTTFSAASVEGVRLLGAGRTVLGALNAAAVPVAAVLLATAGLAIAATA